MLDLASTNAEILKPCFLLVIDGDEATFYRPLDAKDQAWVRFNTLQSFTYILISQAVWPSVFSDYL